MDQTGRLVPDVHCVLCRATEDDTIRKGEREFQARREFAQIAYAKCLLTLLTVKENVN